MTIIKKMIKSRRLKSRKYKKKTRGRLHLGKINHRGGGIHIDITDDEKYIYITDTTDHYLYKIDLPKKTYEMNNTEGGAYPLNTMTQRLRNIINNARGGNDRIASILNTMHEFDLVLPAKSSPMLLAGPGKVFVKHIPSNPREPWYYIPPIVELPPIVKSHTPREPSPREPSP